MDFHTKYLVAKVEVDGLLAALDYAVRRKGFVRGVWMVVVARSIMKHHAKYRGSRI